jgi:mannose-6-phosphate isomerase class I
MQVPLIRLQCGVNSYDWGKVGSDSAAAKFAAATPADNFSIQQDKPYAEVWIKSIEYSLYSQEAAMDGHASFESLKGPHY